MEDKRHLRVRSLEFKQFAERIEHVTALTSRLNVLPFDDKAGRAALMAEIVGKPVPDSVTVYPPFYTEYGLGIEFGERVFVNQGCTFMDYGGIRLGDGVMIAPKVNLITVGHPVDPVARHEYVTAAPITLEDHVWIGAAATILPGVTIGHDAVVGAGAVVTKDVPAGALVTGPAAFERELSSI